MQHLTTAEKSLLVGDRTADLLMEYAALVAQIKAGDSIKINALGADGDEVVATLLLNSGTTMVAETTTSTQREPDNAEVDQYLQDRLAAYNVYPTGLEVTGADADSDA